ncbi:TPA: hypothetical protein ACGOYX_001508 [Streptococcus suis]
MTNFRYPNLEMIESLFVGISALEKVCIEGGDVLEKTYSKGAFFYHHFLQILTKIFLRPAQIKSMILQKIYHLKIIVLWVVGYLTSS